MRNITMQDLHIFRGTYKECMARTTEDMEIYLAWDTQEIFVGNKYGTKVKYGGVSSLKKQLSILMADYTEAIDAEIAKANELISHEGERVTELEGKVSSNSANIEGLAKEVAKVKELLGNVDTDAIEDLNNLTKELENLKNEVEKSYVSNAALAEKLNSYYLKIEIDEMVSEAVNSSKEYTDEREAAIREDIPEIAANPEGAAGSEGAIDLEYITIDGILYKLPEISSGPIVRKEVISTIKASTNGETEFMDGTTNEVSFTISADNIEALASCSYDGEDILGELVGGFTKTITISDDYTTEGRLLYTTKEDTEHSDYSAKAEGLSFSFYTPWLIGTEGNMTAFKYTSSGNGQTFTISANEEYVYVYSPTEIEDPENQIMAYGFTFPVVEGEPIEINGTQYKVYKSAEMVNDPVLRLTIY